MGDEELYVSGELHLIVASSPSKDRNCETLKVFLPDRPGVLFPIHSDGEKRGPFNLGQVGKDAAESAEREIIETALHQTHWNRREAAKLLYVSYKTMLCKIQKYHLEGVGGLRTIDGGQDGRAAGSTNRAGIGPDS